MNARIRRVSLSALFTLSLVGCGGNETGTPNPRGSAEGRQDAPSANAQPDSAAKADAALLIGHWELDRQATEAEVARVLETAEGEMQALAKYLKKTIGKMILQITETEIITHLSLGEGKTMPYQVTGREGNALILSITHWTTRDEQATGEGRAEIKDGLLYLTHPGMQGTVMPLRKIDSKEVERRLADLPLQNASPNDKPGERIMWLVNDKPEVAERKLREQPDLLNLMDPSPASRGSTLHYAAAFGNVELVRLLLKHGADPKAIDPQRKRTPLHEAAAEESDNPELCKLLIDAGADINAPDVNQSTPLSLSLDYGRQRVAEFLKSRGAQYSAPTPPKDKK